MYNGKKDRQTDPISCYFGGNMNYDLKLFSLNYIQGQLQADVPGLFAAVPPKRAARGRQEDCLIIHLDLHSEKPLLNEQKEWLGKLTDNFYKTPGSVTSAMSVVVEMLSNLLMESNLNLVSDHDRLSAYLNLGVIHHENLFVAQIGPIHAYWVGSQGMAHFFDPDANERGLGLTRTPDVRYYQHSLGSEDCFISTLSAPEHWTEDQIVSTGNFDQTWRRLHHNLPANMRGALVQILPGSNEVIPLQPDAALSTTLQPEVVSTSAEGSAVVVEVSEKESTESPLIPMNEAEIGENELGEETDDVETEAAEALGEFVGMDAGDSDETAENFDEDNLPDDELDLDMDDEGDVEDNFFEDTSDLPQESLDGQTFSADLPPGIPDEFISQNPDGMGATDTPEAVMDWHPQDEVGWAEESPTLRVKPERKRQGLRVLSNLFDRIELLGAKIRTFFRPLKEKLVTTTGLAENQLSKTSMLVIAIIVPLLIVTLAASVYITRGKNRQYDYLLAQAQAAAGNAQLLNGEAAQRTGWEEVIRWSEQAGEYRQSPEVDQLIQQAQAVLDVLDGATRLSYQPAIDGVLEESVVISQVIAITNDLYLLDSTSGRVIHLTFGNRGYLVDDKFSCEPGVYSGVSVGHLVGLVEIPINNIYQAPIMAVDESANLLYCRKDNTPAAAVLAQPQGGLGRIQSVLLDAGSLYLLDPVRNALWVYYGSASEFTTAADSFFDDFPIDLGGAIDLASNGDEIYLLFGDGHLATCVAPGYSSANISCTNPTPMVDTRENTQPLDVPMLKFNQVAYVSPRDPSVMILSATSGDIVQFSRHLTLNRIFRNNIGTQLGDGQEATAFGISANRNAYLAIGDLLFYAVIP